MLEFYLLVAAAAHWVGTWETAAAGGGASFVAEVVDEHYQESSH
jgi:hypothetical protein